jgi:hypothetical protein
MKAEYYCTLCRPLHSHVPLILTSLTLGGLLGWRGGHAHPASIGSDVYSKDAFVTFLDDRVFPNRCFSRAQVLRATPETVAPRFSRHLSSDVIRDEVRGHSYKY